jgi:hypothetical protein
MSRWHALFAITLSTLVTGNRNTARHNLVQFFTPCFPTSCFRGDSAIRPERLPERSVRIRTHANAATFCAKSTRMSCVWRSAIRSSCSRASVIRRRATLREWRSVRTDVTAPASGSYWRFRVSNLPEQDSMSRGELRETTLRDSSVKVPPPLCRCCRLRRGALSALCAADALSAAAAGSSPGK